MKEITEINHYNYTTCKLDSQANYKITFQLLDQSLMLIL